jgi:phosphatidylethanolamine-binding protein (PEBP) family uncharacterized protein
MGKPHTITIAAIALTALLAGCGSTTSKTTASAPTNTQTTTPTTPAVGQTQATTPATTATTPADSAPPHHELSAERVELTSPAVNAHGELDARYTCNGQNISPPLHWRGIPAGTRELMLEVLKIKPVAHKLYFDWALTHINPKSHSVAQGQTPPGSIPGQNSAGHTTYDLCPPKGQTEHYVAALWALPHPLLAKPGYDPISQREKAQSDAEYLGYLRFTYKQH